MHTGGKARQNVIPTLAKKDLIRRNLIRHDSKKLAKEIYKFLREKKV